MDHNRPRRSCEQCRAKKTKCSGERPQCSHCRRQGKQCIYRPRNNHRPTTLPRPSSSPQRVATTHDARSPADLFDHVLQVYQASVYCQPLPLFNPATLRHALPHFPSYLRSAVLALTLRLSNHPAHRILPEEASSLYTSTSRNVVLQKAMQGDACLQVRQTLCLLALGEILDGLHVQAFATVGAAARLEAIKLRTSTAQEDDELRCHWSIRTLDNAFTSTPNMNHPTAPLPYPSSPERPLPTDIMAAREEDISNRHEIRKGESEVIANYLQAFQMWSKVAWYFEDMRLGNRESPWLASSRYHQLTADLYQQQADLSDLHLYRNVGFSRQNPADLRNRQDYWIPWISMQIGAHATPAVLNNPFVQLFVLQSDKGLCQPRSFLQQTVDQALFHSAWVGRLLRECDRLELPIDDPILGQMIAATATIPFLFRFSRDAKVSRRAAIDLQTCLDCLAQLAKTWPLIAKKHACLLNLQSTVEQDGQLRLQPEALWYVVCGDFLDEPSRSLSEAQIHITTSFIEPVGDTIPGEENELQPDHYNWADYFVDSFMVDNYLVGLEP
ncbi:uncharacterized protein F5Z01DRAFT_622227 [Emericellopsis atlantica]|uniref:Zn(2)-C6 fungal-type domain-containing protein n=1 Tax=Emericellopsis atlantica TaxID=2614577 RepID=A0A9P8CP30_9HYPO|nr:uncharacterized protein F5Z01DRAFT_622227 [Emericellopsis atlantica]KAG9254399.1 hypothetical protein F5Z01DRAFT_622227 [Emericellopsis atlantica]